MKFTSRAVKERYYEMLQIIVLKGLYYLKVMPMELAAFSRMSSAIDKILNFRSIHVSSSVIWSSVS